VLTCNLCGHDEQVEKDRLQLYQLLLTVPVKVVKHLQREAQVGYEKSRAQVEAAQGNSGEADEQADADALVSVWAGPSA
jgi:hypothetical protein